MSCTDTYSFKFLKTNYDTIKTLSSFFNKDYDCIQKILKYNNITPVVSINRGSFYTKETRDILQNFFNQNQEHLQNKIRFSELQKSFPNLDRTTLKNILEELSIEIYKSYNNVFYCSKEAPNKVQEFIEKYPNTRSYFTTKTCMKKYGKTNISQVEFIKQKVQETTKRNNKKEIRKKAKETYLNNILQEKIELEQTYGKLYSYEEVSTLVNRDKSSLTSILVRLGIYDALIKSRVSPHLYLTEDQFNKMKQTCGVIDIKTTSFMEKEIVDFIESIYQGTIIENSHKVIQSKELDIYIPEKQVAIEFDGLLWHSTLRYQRVKHRLPTKEEKDICRTKHLEKTIACEKQGIRLIHIFEDEWLDKKDICKSIIASALDIYKEKIYARKCEIKEVPLKIYREFLNQNHIQGYAKADLMYGLYFQQKLVQCMGITKSNHKTGEIELNRMASLLNTQVIGGFSKLIKFICDKHNINTLYSYVSRRLFTGKGYKQIGFRKILENKPTYFYTFREKRYPRYTFMRNKIQKKFNEGKLYYWNPEETEEINMYKNGYGRIWDCGTIKIAYFNK